MQHPLEECPGCAAPAGTWHDADCDHAACPDCGEQKIACEETGRPAFWHGQRSEDLLALEHGWQIWIVDLGWVEDGMRMGLERHRGAVSWDPVEQRWFARRAEPFYAGPCQHRRRDATVLRPTCVDCGVVLAAEPLPNV